jgi:hypothetical protein
MRGLPSIILIGLFLAGGGFAQTASQPSAKAEAAGVSFELVVMGDEVEVTLSAKTLGFIAFGLDPSSRMADADIVIGYVKGGKAFARDDFGTSGISHAADATIGGKDGIVSVTGSEKDGVTTLKIRLKRLSADPKDKPFTPGQHKLILSYGAQDDFTLKHASRGSTAIDVPAPK